jgi:hypothetical protein
MTVFPPPHVFATYSHATLGNDDKWRGFVTKTQTHRFSMKFIMRLEQFWCNQLRSGVSMLDHRFALPQVSGGETKEALS